MTTRAEQVAASKPPRRAPGSKRQPQPRVWKCLARQARLSLRLSIRDVAPEVGLSVTGLWQVEHGTDPQLTTARRIAAFYGRAVEELWPELAEGKEGDRV